MTYPSINEYIEAIRFAEDNFDQLKHLRPVLGGDGEPVMTSGNFAVVFQMKDEQTGKLHAVKCFLREQEGRAEAYRQIAEELEYVSSTFLTSIKYLDKELFVDSSNSEDSEFPVLLMDWVEGQTLDKYIREHIDDQYELSLLAYQFSRLAMWLMPQPFAHGDLKPDNILVKEDGTLVLVDYDGMYVPAMKGQKARELGSPDFRHPLRSEYFWEKPKDDFSLMTILLSLKAISIEPNLLERYGASDRLLLSAKDYCNISQCELLKELFPSSDIELNNIYGLFLLTLGEFVISENIIEKLVEKMDANLWDRASLFCHGSKLSANTYWKDIYKDQLPINPDKEKAFLFFKDLAIRGSSQAQRCLGCLLWERGSDQDKSLSLYWYRQAANNGDKNAITHLVNRGKKLFIGDGVKQDFREAITLFQMAADFEDKYAIIFIILCYENGLGISLNNDFAQTWFGKIKSGENAYDIGRFYYEGKVISRNYEKALKWFRVAANLEYEEGIMMMGFCLENGLGTLVDNQQAQLWYDKIKEGYSSYCLGVKYFLGKEVPQDYVKAVFWFNNAISKGEISAYPFLGVCYKEGLGLVKDIHNSENCFSKASSDGFDTLMEYFFHLEKYEICVYLLRNWLLILQNKYGLEWKEYFDSLDVLDYEENLKTKGFSL